MFLLLIDTAAATGGVLLARHEGKAHAGSQIVDAPHTEVLGEESLHTREFSRELIPAIDRLMQKNRIKLSDLDALAVVSGPGSFTGLRIGLSTVKAMAEATAKPVIALSRLAVMASVAATSADTTTIDTTIIHTILDAGRGTFSHGIYRDAGRTPIGERFESGAELTGSLGAQPGLVAASEPSVLDLLGQIRGVAAIAIPEVSVRQALPLALAGWEAGDFADVALLDAHYLRRMNPGIEPQVVGDPKPGNP